MKTRSLGIAFAALLAFAPVRGHAEGAANAPANAATPTSDRPADAPRPSIVPKTAEGAPAPTTEPAMRKRRSAKKQLRRYAYWEPFPIYYRHHLSWRRVAWFGWF